MIKIIELLLGQQKQTLDTHRIRYDENSEVILLKPNILGKRSASGSNKKPTLACFECICNDHLNYASPYKKPNQKRSKNEMDSEK